MSSEVNDCTPYLASANPDEIIDAALQILESRLVRGVAIGSPDDMINYLSLKLGPQEREVFACIFLDNRNRLIAYEELFFGTIDGATIHPREIVKRALALNAAALIVAHNHPSGAAEPSPADTAITKRIKEAVSLVDIRLLDHIVVGVGSYTSLAQRGLL